MNLSVVRICREMYAENFQRHTWGDHVLCAGCYYKDLSTARPAQPQVLRKHCLVCCVSVTLDDTTCISGKADVGVLNVHTSRTPERWCSCHLHSSQPSSGSMLFRAQVLVQRNLLVQADSTQVALLQAAESRSRRTAEPPAPQGSLPRLQDRAVTPPAAQCMQQQPVEIVALGVPMPQHMREPSMGYPNNVAYLGQAVVDERVHQWLDVVVREHHRA